MIELFDIVENKLEINAKEVLMYKEFADIYAADKSPDKKIAYDIFKYIVFTCRTSSHAKMRGMSSKLRHAHALANTDLPKTYTPTDLVRRAMAKYTELNKTLISSMLEDVTAALEMGTQGVSCMKDQMEVMIEEISSSKTDEKKQETINKLIATMQKVLDFSNTLPASIIKLTSLKEQYEKQIELSSLKSKQRGGKEHKSSYDGDGEDNTEDVEVLN